MLQFDPQKYSYASHRNIVYAKKGMACSTSPIASQVGLDIMKAGGNAMDAAIAMATTLPLVEPTGNGLGSDCFALVWSAKDSKLYGLDSIFTFAFPLMMGMLSGVYTSLCVSTSAWVLWNDRKSKKAETKKA